MPLPLSSDRSGQTLLPRPRPERCHIRLYNGLALSFEIRSKSLTALSCTSFSFKLIEDMTIECFSNESFSCTMLRYNAGEPPRLAEIFRSFFMTLHRGPLTKHQITKRFLTKKIEIENNLRISNFTSELPYIRLAKFFLCVLSLLKS